MDAFSVSIANALNEPEMKKRRMTLIAGIFAGFQIAMPLIGWFCVSTLTDTFKVLNKFIPWIALILLLLIGGKMIIEGIKGSEEEQDKTYLGMWGLIVQGIATSIDALSVGFTISGYTIPFALTEAFIIGAVTFAICMAGLVLGKKIGNRISGRASLLGGVILVLIGVEIFIKGVFF